MSFHITPYWLWVFFLSLAAQPLCAQPPGQAPDSARRSGVLVGRERTRGETSSDGCRLDRSKLGPLIAPDNPFFAKHRWDPVHFLESAQLSPQRQLSIEQGGCELYSRKFTYVVAPEISQPENLGFYATELFNLMNRLFYNSPEYWRYKLEFERMMLETFPNYGLDSPFNFRWADYTFVCEFSYHPEVGAVAILEIVSLPSTTPIRYPGVPTYEDDGWFRPAH